MKLRVHGLSLEAWGVDIRVLALQGLGFRVEGLGFRVQGLGFTV
jgi:hypothetical protein